MMDIGLKLEQFYKFGSFIIQIKNFESNLKLGLNFGSFDLIPSPTPPPTQNLYKSKLVNVNSIIYIISMH